MEKITLISILIITISAIDCSVVPTISLGSISYQALHSLTPQDGHGEGTTGDIVHHYTVTAAEPFRSVPGAGDLIYLNADVAGAQAGQATDSALYLGDNVVNAPGAFVGAWSGLAAA